MALDGNNGNNVRRCGQIGEGEDDELSMVDVLNEEARLQADADAVLGGSDENNCTYPQGYIKRQALYACATCAPEGNAGICLACSYACHEGHDLYELYTKRFFRCDCGNDKFGGKECKLYKDKKEMSANNCYSQNFRGLYCSCSRPYPDPDDTVEDEMIQCILCEDWYHGRHLKAKLPDHEDFTEMTCPECMSKYDFLWAYYMSSVKLSNGHEDDTDENIDVCSTPKEEVPGASSEIDHLDDQGPNPPCDHGNRQPDSSSSPVQKRERVENDTSKGANMDAPTPKKMKLDAEPHEEEEDKPRNAESDEQKENHCVLKSLLRLAKESPNGAAFWQDGWRSKLCQCGDCLQMYKDKNIEFLIDESDTVSAYEELGRSSARSADDHDSTASVLAGMNRVQQIEVVQGFMDLKTELNEFLQGFAQNGKVVTESDIREFFQRMEKRRKDRTPVLQYNCR